jgi:hypothetical protein
MRDDEKDRDRRGGRDFRIGRMEQEPHRERQNAGCRDRAERVPATTATKTATTASTASGHRTENPPTAVATPLPPRNPNQTGKTWPSTAAHAAAPSQSGSYVTACIRSTASVPFPTSRSIVRVASRFPDVRSTFVAPALPEPSRLTSTPRNTRTRTTAKEIDPSR